MDDEQEAPRPPNAELLAAHPLIIAANRGPVEFTRREEGGFTHKRGSGGVVTAMSALGRYVDPVWVASAMTEGDRQVAIAAGGEAVVVEDEGEPPLKIHFATVPTETYDLAYNQISNEILWFLQHYLWDAAHEPDIDQQIWRAWDVGYSILNLTFANTIHRAAELTGSDRPIVMLQDYHLYLVAETVRERLPHALIQQFIHIPWPDKDYWMFLPARMRQEICRGLLANDVVGFQTFDHCHNFIRTCVANVPGAEGDHEWMCVRYKGRTIKVRPYPISLDVGAVRRTASNEAVAEYVNILQDYLGEQTIVRVDRAEPSKNVLRGFKAFDLFLERYPEWHGRVRFLSLLVPSRLAVPRYQQYLDDIYAIMGRINTKHGTEKWRPVRLLVGENYERALAALTLYDALLVNSLADGMNLVAKEGALLNERGGVLILSETAGAHEQLGAHAISIAPCDIAGTADALHFALTMPTEERFRRATALRASVENADIVRWITDQLDDIATIERDTQLSQR
jgi:trehalose 6-phosphate synthase